jgi:hypothetical protein
VARQAFYDDVSVQTRNENRSDVLALFIDGSASMGVGALPGAWERGEPRALGPWGNRHVNPAGQEMREWLQVEGLASARTFFRPKGDMYDTWWHPKSKLGYSLDQIIVRGSQIGRVKKACTLSAVSVASDHVATYLELHVGRMQRQQKAAGQTKRANIDVGGLAVGDGGLAVGAPGGEPGGAGGGFPGHPSGEGVGGVREAGTAGGGVVRGPPGGVDGARGGAQPCGGGLA